MRYCDWDEVLDRDGLLILTEEALAPPRRSRAPMRRLAAAAACAGLVLGLVNYQAVAAGTERVIRYFLGVGAAEENLSLLVGLARKLEQRFHIRLPMVSGGNSSSIYLIEQGNLPEGINNLRLGESFLLGNDTAYGTRIPGTVGDALELEAEVIEIKEKPSLPVGEIGVDAFGHRPTYEDKGIMRRAIVAVGRQDVDTDSLQPRDPQIEILGGSSDHLLLDLTHCTTVYQVGDRIQFTLGYGSMLKAFTSPYVEKVI